MPQSNAGTMIMLLTSKRMLLTQSSISPRHFRRPLRTGNHRNCQKIGFTSLIQLVVNRSLPKLTIQVAGVLTLLGRSSQLMARRENSLITRCLLVPRLYQRVLMVIEKWRVGGSTTRVGVITLTMETFGRRIP